MTLDELKTSIERRIQQIDQEIAGQPVIVGVESDAPAARAKCELEAVLEDLAFVVASSHHDQTAGDLQNSEWVRDPRTRGLVDPSSERGQEIIRESAFLKPTTQGDPPPSPDPEEAANASGHPYTRGPVTFDRAASYRPPSPADKEQ